MINKFGFIVHPIDRQTFYGHLGYIGKFMKLLPENISDRLTLSLSARCLVSYSKIRSLKGAVAGEIVTLPLLPIQFASLSEEKVLDAIEKGINLCAKSGAKIVGLGGFSSVVGNEGEILSKRVSVPLTSGNTLTASLALDGIYRAAYLMGLPLSNATVAVIGATGDIGSICTKILSKKVNKLNIAARNEQKLQEFAGAGRRFGAATVDVFKYTQDAVCDADIVLSATSAVTTIIDSANLKPGAIVCDVAIPPNIAKEVAIQRDDVLVFEGGLARLPYPGDIINKTVIDLLPRNSIYGCIAETMTLALEGKFEAYSIGRGNITEEKLAAMKTLAANNGITVSDFLCGYKIFTEEDIEKIRINAKTKREKEHAAQR
jgi:fatty aldehyde-generating acyl-ACP reductase